MARPAFYFDGDCGFCTRAAELMRRLQLGSTIEPWQFSDIARHGITPEQASEAVQFVDASGRVSAGHRAIAGALRTGVLPIRLIGVALVAPGISQIADVVYRLVARYRYRLPGGTPACAARPTHKANLNEG